MANEGDENVFEDLNQKSPFIQLVKTFIEAKIVDAHIPPDLSHDMRESLTRYSLRKSIADSSPSKAEALRFVYDIIEQTEDDVNDIDIEDLKTS